MPNVSRFCLFVGLSLLTVAPGLAATRIERELKLGKGGSVVLRTSGGGIHVVGGSRSTVHVVITAKRDIEADYDVDFSEESGNATVRVEHKKDVSHWFGMGDGDGVRLEVEVPSDAALDAHTSGGPIEAEGVRGDVSVNTSGGSITLAHVDGAVRAETSGGRIHIQDAGGDVHAGTSGGAIEILAARGRVEAETSGGPVRVEFAKGNARGGNLSSSGGSVTVSLDPSIGLELDASTSGGRVVADVPVKVHGDISKSALRGTIGEGGATLKLHSAGGGIRIEDATAR